MHRQRRNDRGRGGAMAHRVRGLATKALLLALPLAACDSDPTHPGGDDPAVVTGSMAEAQQTAPAATPGGEQIAAQAAGQASMVVIGEVASGGSLHSLGEAEVAANGSFRIEGVPAGRANLVVVAYNEAEAEVGRVVLHERTSAGMEHRTHPIDARSTLHARVWTEVRASANGRAEMEPAELSLYLHADGATAAQAAGSSAEIRAIAEAALEAQAVLSAVLEAEGHAGLDAATRAGLFADLAAERDRSRDAGAGADASQEAFVSAALSALADQQVSMKTFALASASATSAFDASLAESSSNARLALTKQAVLVNLETRKRATADVQGNTLGLRGTVSTTLSDTEAGVRAAGTIAELKGSLAQARAEGQTRVVTNGLNGLIGLPGELVGDLHAHFESALLEARLWSELEAAASGQAKAAAAADFRAQVEVAVQDFLEQIPADAKLDAGVTAEIVTAFLIALGAGPHCH